MDGAAFSYGPGKIKDLWGGAGRGRQKQRYVSPLPQFRPRKRDPERVLQDSETQNSLSLFFFLPSSRPPDFLSFPLCLSISSEPIPLVPPICAALIRGIYYIIIKSRHTASNSHEVLTRFSCRQKCLLRISIHYILL